MTDPPQTRTSPRDLANAAADTPAKGPSGPLGNQDDTLPASDSGQKQTGKAARSLSQADLLGRYVVLSRLGAGGMGVVYAAYDPELDRKVAVKLLLADRCTDTARARLLREAQALARLAHPNVVAVHDVGVHDDQVFVAMEFVQGMTVREWVKEDDPTWNETLDVMLAAGRGLVAAHESGLVHRDFKPDNVMVGTDGRVRVMDFGLARVSTDSSVDVEPANQYRDSVEVTRTLTALGAMPGTPAYMATEQWQGAPADAVSDQFSFCATLWECLYRARPFTGESLADLGAAICEERVAEPDGQRDAPAWLRSILRRGLGADPASRWPDLATLLAELERARQRARWRWARIGGVVLVAGCVGFVGLRAKRSADIETGCEEAAGELATQWNDVARDGLRTAFTSLPSYGPDGAARTIAALDDWAENWADVRKQTCLELDPELASRADACLDIRRADFNVVAEALQEPNPRLVADGHQMAASLESPLACGSEEYLQRQTPLTEVEYDRLHAIRMLVAETERLELAGESDLAIANARLAVAEAEQYDLRLGRIEAQLALGLRLSVNGEFVEGESTLINAYELASETDETAYAAEAAFSIAQLLGADLQRPDEARIWWRVATAAFSRLPDPDGVRELELKRVLATIEIADANYDEARRLLEELLELHRTTLGANPLGVGGTYANLGFLYTTIGESEKAIAPLEFAIKELTDAFGPTYPILTTVYNNLANSRWETGDIEGAERDARLAIELSEAGFGKDHPETAVAKATLGMLLATTESAKDPLPLLSESLAVFEQAHGLAHPYVGEVACAIGFRHEFQGNAAEARRYYERAADIKARHSEPGDTDLAVLRNRLGTVLLDLGEPGAARSLLRNAFEILEHSEDIEKRSASLTSTAYLARLDGDLPLALARAELAWKIEGLEPRFRGLVAFELATVLRELPPDQGGDRARARQVVEEALHALPERPCLARRKLEPLAEEGG